MKPDRHVLLHAARALVLALGLVYSGRAFAAPCIGTYTDAFPGSTLEPFWTSNSTCGTIQVTGGQLVLTKTSGCEAYGGPYVAQDSTVTVLCGDFDVRVDFNLVIYPVPTDGDLVAGLRVYQSGGPWAGTIERYNRALGACNPSTQNYKAFSTNSDNCGGSSAVTWLPTTDETGSFRLTRTGSTIGMYYGSGGGWALLRSDPVVTSNLYAFLYLGTNGGLNTAATVAFSNFSMVSGTAGVAGDVLPREPELARPAPNPAHLPLALHYALPRAATVRLAIYDVAGRRVRLLLSGEESAGRHDQPWDLRSDDGRSLGAGLYFVRLDVEGRTLSQCLAVLR